VQETKPGKEKGLGFVSNCTGPDPVTVDDKRGPASWNADGASFRQRGLTGSLTGGAHLPARLKEEKGGLFRRWWDSNA
jgi:hypothetical protein